MLQRIAPVLLCAFALVACEGGGPGGNGLFDGDVDGSGADGGVDLGDITNPDGAVDNDADAVSDADQDAVADVDPDVDPDAETDAETDGGDVRDDALTDASDGSGEEDGNTDALTDVLSDADVLLDDTGDVIPDDADGSGDTGDVPDINIDLDGFVTDTGDTISDADEDVQGDTLSDVDPDSSTDVDPDATLIDCQLGEFSDWSVCTSTTGCGEGQEVRTRGVVVEPSAGGAECGELMETRPCDAGPCGVDCVTSDWSEYGECNVLCGGGEQTRTRTILVEPEGDGAACGVLQDSRACNTQPCDVDCEVGEWSEFGVCDVACGGGNSNRTREILVAPQGGGAACPETEESVRCNEAPCPVDCELGPFTDWSDCSEVCGDGVQSRSRAVLVEPEFGGAACGELEETRPCNDRPCTDDCIVSDWTPFTLCSASCGGGTSYREREIIRPPQNGGAACPTLLRQEVPCNTQPCPIDCEVGDFSQATSCSVLCGDGVEIWSREVLVAPQFGGDACPPLEESRPCSGPPCPIDCEVGDWSDFGPCSEVCDGGTRTRTRVVTRPAEFGGAACTALEETEDCNTDACPPPEWVPGEWGPCESGGFRSRDIECVSTVTGEVVSDSECTETRPPATESCASFDCDPADPCCTDEGDFRNAGVPCRPSRGSCDVADTCNGYQGTCPADLVQPPGQVCFASVGFTFYSGRCLEGRCLSEAYGCSVALPTGGLPYPCTNTEDPCGTGYSCQLSQMGACQSGLDPFGDGSNGIPCTPAGQTANSGMCQAGTCRTNDQLKRYQYVPGPWSPCAGGTQTRTITCTDETGAVVASTACNGPAPAASRSCLP
jgi:hypothetical protein